MQTITTPAGIYTPPATALIQKVQLRIFESCPSATLRLMQYDRALPVIAVELFEGGNPYKVPENAAVNIRMVKPDKTTVYNPALGVSSDRKTTYIGITPQMTACFGSCTATLEIALNDGVLGTGLLRLSIEKNPVSEDAVESSDEYLSLQEIVNKVQTYADKAEAAAETAEAAAESAMNSVQSDLAENNETAVSYVKNRTHWKEVLSTNGVLLQETFVKFTGNMASVSGVGTDNVKVGGKYIVTWAGTTYECIAYELNGGVCLGNAALFNMGNDTGEPFVIETMSATGSIVTKNDEVSATVSLAVKSVDNTVWHQLDPRYIPDMYYTDEGGRQTVLSETTAEFAPGQILTGPPEYILPNVLNLVEGQTYYVTWDGEEYECVCKKAAVTINGASMEALLIGNRVFVGEDNTGEPFVMGTIISPMNISLAVTFSSNVEDTFEYTFKIEETTETIHKLDNKYLDLAWLPYMVKTAGKTLFDETVHFSSGGSMNREEVPFTITPGKTYFVTWEGVEYECVAKHTEWSTNAEDRLPVDYIGNLSLADSSEENSGEPFVLYIWGNYIFVIDNDTIKDAESHVKVAEGGLKPNKMPAEFLPEAVTYDLAGMGMPTLVTGEDVTLELGEEAAAEVREHLLNGVRVGLVIPFQPKTSAGTGDVNNYTVMFSGNVYNGRWQWSGAYIEGSAVHEINLQADPNSGTLYAMAREVNGSGGGSGSLPEGFDPLAVVSVNTQSFTTEQQARARNNIGAASQEDAENAYNYAESAWTNAVNASNRATLANDTALEAEKTAQAAVDEAAAARKSAETAEDNAVGALAAVNQKAPNNHASLSATYGIGTDAAYGHVKLSDTASAAKTEGIAATPLAVYRVKQEILSNAQQSDWSQNDTTAANYVKNRTHWINKSEKALWSMKGVFPEDVKQYSSMEDPAPLLVAGTEYLVRWNGTEYTCTAYVDTQMVSIGGESYGLPFLISTHLQSNTLDISAYDDTVTAFDITIIELVEDVHKMDNKYLGLDWKPSIEQGAVLWEVELSEGGYKLHTKPEALSGKEIADSRYVEVVLNGRSFICTPWTTIKNNEEWVWVGNEHVSDSSSRENTGEPFLIGICDRGRMVSTKIAPYGTYTLSLRTVEYNRMPQEYLPESVDGVIIRSSTEDSSKKFRLTIDDSGAITATEV